MTRAFQDIAVSTRPLSTVSLSPEVSANLPAVRAITAIAVAPKDLQRVLAGRAGTESRVIQQMLKENRASDADEVGAQLNEAVGLLKGLDPSSLKKDGGLLYKIRHLGASVKEHFHAEYDSTKARLETIVSEIDAHIALHERRLPEFDEMYEQNRSLCLAYETEDKPVVAQQIAALSAQAEAMGLSKDVFAAHDRARIENEVEELNKFLFDLEIKIKRCHQRAPFLEARRVGARALIAASRRVKEDLIPIWETTIGDYLFAKEQAKTAQLDEMMHDLTDAAMRKQAEANKDAIVSVARVRERELVKVDTLEYCNAQLIEGLENARQIHLEGVRRREQDLPRLAALDQQLLDLANKSAV